MAECEESVESLFYFQQDENNIRVDDAECAVDFVKFIPIANEESIRMFFLNIKMISSLHIFQRNQS